MFSSAPIYNVLEPDVVSIETDTLHPTVHGRCGEPVLDRDGKYRVLEPATQWTEQSTRKGILQSSLREEERETPVYQVLESGQSDWSPTKDGYEQLRSLESLYEPLKK